MDRASDQGAHDLDTGSTPVSPRPLAPRLLVHIGVSQPVALMIYIDEKDGTREWNKQSDTTRESESGEEEEREINDNRSES